MAILKRQGYKLSSEYKEYIRKMIDLHEYGMEYYAIAKEMHCEEQYVRNTIHDYRNGYLNALLQES